MEQNYSYDPAKFCPQRLLYLLQRDVQPTTQYTSIEYIMGRIVTALITEVGGGHMIMSNFLRIMEESSRKQLEELKANPLFETRRRQYLDLSELFPNEYELHTTARLSDWVAMNNCFRALLKNSEIQPNTPFVDERGELLDAPWLYVIYSKNQGADRQKRGHTEVNVWLRRCLKHIEGVVDALLKNQSQRLSPKMDEEQLVASSVSQLNVLQDGDVSLSEETRALLAKMKSIKDIILLERNISHAAVGSCRSLEGTIVGRICELYDVVVVESTPPPNSVECSTYEPVAGRSSNSSNDNEMVLGVTPISAPPSIDSLRLPLSTLPRPIFLTTSSSSEPIDVPASPRALFTESSSSSMHATLEKSRRLCMDRLVSLYGAISGAVKARWDLVRLLSLTIGVEAKSTSPIAPIQELEVDGSVKDVFYEQFTTLSQSWVYEKTVEIQSSSVYSEYYEEIKMGLESYLKALRSLRDLSEETVKISVEISKLDRPSTTSFGFSASPRSHSAKPETPRTVKQSLFSLLSGFGSLFNLMTECFNQAAGASVMHSAEQRVAVSPVNRSSKVPEATRISSPTVTRKNYTAHG